MFKTFDLIQREAESPLDPCSLAPHTQNAGRPGRTNLILLLSEALGQGVLTQLVRILGTEETAEQGIDVGGLRGGLQQHCQASVPGGP